MPLRCVCIGECMVEMRSLGGGLYSKSYAGDAYNTAVYLRRNLGVGDEVAFLTAVGDDGESAAMRAAFRSEGVDDRLAFLRPGERPGLYLIELDAAGERSFHYWRSTSAARGWLDSLVEAGSPAGLEDADLVYLSGISLAILPANRRASAVSLVAELKGRVGAIAFDPNVRPALWESTGAARETIQAVAAISDILLPSGEDGSRLWAEPDPEAQLRRWRSYDAPEVALTTGAEGGLFSCEAGDGRVAAPVPPGAVIDTTGAGDSFNGAYLAARLQGRSPAGAMALGLRCASHVVTQPGAIIPATAASGR